MISVEIPEEFKREWQMAERVHTDMALRLLTQFECPKSMEGYVLSRKGFVRWVYPMSGWIPQSDIRYIAGSAFAMHSLGMKLLDDIIDADTQFSPSDLLVGYQFCNQACTELASIGAIDEFLSIYNEFWPDIWRHVKKEPGAVYSKLSEWIDSSYSKCGRLLHSYAAVASLIIDRPEITSRLEPAFRAMGVILTLLDDLRDYESPAEQHANVRRMIERGVVTRSDVEAVLEGAASQLIHCLKVFPPTFPVNAAYLDAIRKCRAALKRTDMAVVDLVERPSEFLVR